LIDIKLLYLRSLKNLNFYDIENIYVDIDLDKLNVIFSTNGHKRVDGDDEINQREFNKADDENKNKDSH
jgi:hypothetical protein